MKKVKCKVCGKEYAEYEKAYVEEMQGRGTFMCKPCYNKRSAGWAEREKRYRTADGRQIRGIMTPDAQDYFRNRKA